MWSELIEELKKNWKENPPEWKKTNWLRGYHGVKFTELLSAGTLMVSSSDTNWVYANYLSCEYDPPCPYPPLDVMVPLNPLMSPPGFRIGRRACRRHALEMVDPLHNYVSGEHDEERVQTQSPAAI